MLERLFGLFGLFRYRKTYLELYIEVLEGASQSDCDKDMERANILDIAFKDVELLPIAHSYYKNEGRTYYTYRKDINTDIIYIINENIKQVIYTLRPSVYKYSIIPMFFDGHNLYIKKDNAIEKIVI